ncbi:unnamed protein product, partial [Adineta steineri]
KNRDVSLNFAQLTATNPDLIGILFVMSINPTDSTSPFASVTDVSYFHTEDEVLFSMHTVFRIGDIKPMDGNNDLYQANLTLTSDNDQDLRTLTDRIRQETFPDPTGWDILGELLIKMGQFNKAQEIYEILLHQTTNESVKAPIYNQLGAIKNYRGEYPEALTYYEKSLAIYQITLPFNHRDLGVSYMDIGNVYRNMDDYSKALSYHEKAVSILQQSLPSNHPDLASSNVCTGIVYYSMGDYPKTLFYHEKDLAISQQSLPSNHPHLAMSYNNIGAVYSKMGDYPKALSYYEKNLSILQQSLPSNHPSLASSYDCMDLVYEKMGNYAKAHSFYERAVQIGHQSLPSNHPNLQNYSKNLENIKKKL